MFDVNKSVDSLVFHCFRVFTAVVLRYSKRHLRTLSLYVSLAQCAVCECYVSNSMFTNFWHSVATICVLISGTLTL